MENTKNKAKEGIEWVLYIYYVTISAMLMAEGLDLDVMELGCAFIRRRDDSMTVFTRLSKKPIKVIGFRGQVRTILAPA